MMKTILTAAAVALTGVAAFAPQSMAGDWRHGGPGYGHAPRHGHYAPAPRHNPYYGYGHNQRRNNGGRIAAGVAIGVGAVILGSILANEARRNHRY